MSWIEALGWRIILDDDVPAGMIKVLGVGATGKAELVVIEDIDVEDAQGGDPNPNELEG